MVNQRSGPMPKGRVDRGIHQPPTTNAPKRKAAAAIVDSSASDYSSSSVSSSPPRKVRFQSSSESSSRFETQSETDEYNHDVEFINRLDNLRANTKVFCDTWFGFKVKGPIEPALVNASPELIRYVGCTALGGPNGHEGWRELIVDKELRKALVRGVVSRALQEHVLSSLLFGADQEFLQKLQDMEKKQVDKDGFYRVNRRAKAIREADRNVHTFYDGRTLTRLLLQLTHLLSPILDLGLTTADDHKSFAAYTQGLNDLIILAAELNHFIRRSGDVVYYFQPLFKDEEFDPARMDCQNLPRMRADCPLQDVDARGRPTPANDPDGDPTDVALVRIVCSLGCVAHRRGGGGLAKRLLGSENEKVDYSLPPELRRLDSANQVCGRTITHRDGFRSKILAKAVVTLRWGKPQFEEHDGHRVNYLELVDVCDELLGKDDTRAAGCGVM